MPAQNGRTLRIKKGDGATTEAFTAVAGAREDSFTCERGEIDITDKDDGKTRKLLEGGIESVSLNVTGMAKNRDLLEAWIAGSHGNWQIEWTDSGDVLEGVFEIGTYEETGAYENNAVEFTLQLRSAGAFTFTAA